MSEQATTPAQWAELGAMGLEVVAGLPNAPNLADQAATSQRIREVWTREEWALFNKASRLMEAHGVKQRLVCGLEQCPDKAIRISPDAAAPMGAVLRCGCTDRVFARPMTPVKRGSSRKFRYKP